VCVSWCRWLRTLPPNELQERATVVAVEKGMFIVFAFPQRDKFSWRFEYFHQMWYLKYPRPEGGAWGLHQGY
jgi:hypothetical protein